MKELEKSIIDVLVKEPYYGYLLLNMKKHITSKVPTAGVNIADGVVNLYVNPEFFLKQTKEVRRGILIHEAMHITNGHLLRKHEDTSASDYNIAADAAINQYIKDLESFPTASFADQKAGKIMPSSIADNLLYKETSEYYLKHLQQNKQNYPKNGDGASLNTVDDHSLWEQGETHADAVQEVLRKTLKQTKDQTEQAKGAGCIPGEVEQTLDELSRSLVSWKGLLRMFFASVASSKKDKTRKRRNRRYGIMYPGKKKEPETKLAIAVDTSGSVSETELNMFFSEIKALSNYVDVMYIIQCDYNVTSVELYNGKTPKVIGRGGTSFTPAFTKATELKVDGLIYFTDGDCFDAPEQPKYPVLWALTPHGTNKLGWGKEIYVRDS